MTTFIKVLEDRAQLEKWGKRMVGVGLAARQQDLLFGLTPHIPVLTTIHGPGQPSASGTSQCVCGSPLNRYGDCEEEKRSKGAVDELVQAAMDAASSSAKATIGTTWHSLTQRCDEGKDLGPMPADLDQAMQRYIAATKGWEWVHIEQLMVLDEYRVAGTPDRIARIPGVDGLVIVDLKTGASTLRFGMREVAMQLAGYSRSVLYNHETGVRAAVPDLRTDIGVVIALNPVSFEVTLRQVNLDAGWKACQVAAWVKDWRQQKNIDTSFEVAIAGQATLAAEAEAYNQTLSQGDVLDGMVVDYPAPTPEAISQGIRHCRTREALIGLWETAAKAGSWTERHTAEAKVRLEDIAGDQAQLAHIRAS
ncbi:PD-(D/E)XK nuclease family protein [Enemella dayhoffiae]|nr:PD-(D/E)XK nuclease family protein [Enemella dayhoffiae]